MKKNFALLLMLMSALCTKAQVTSPGAVRNVSVTDAGAPANRSHKNISDSARVTKNPKATHSQNNKVTTSTAKPADGAVSTNKLADDLFGSHNRLNKTPAKKGEVSFEPLVP